MIDSKEFNEANDRAAELMKDFPRAVSACYESGLDRLLIVLSAGVRMVLPRRRCAELNDAQPADLIDIEISPSGYGLHFPAIDVDIYLPPLLDRSLAKPSGHDAG
ncbi:DUF2442 domain-containing protein [Geopseudomonas aromaticivorans]